MKTTIIHHSADFDGLFCREIARRAFPHAEVIGWDYGDPVPAIPIEETVYILDLSIDGLMHHPGLIWIDHHKSAIEKYPADIPGYRIDGVAACRLAWQWFATDLPDGRELPGKQEYVERLVKEPLAVRLAGEYDIWDKQWMAKDPAIHMFQFALRSTDMTEAGWALMFSDDVVTEQFVKQGARVQKYQRKMDASVIQEFGFNVQWEGLSFLACNVALCNSLLFAAGLTPEHDACLGFNWTGSDWKVSLYHAPGKEMHDLSTIAVRHGGGGHRGACGFRAETLPWIERGLITSLPEERP